MAQSTTSICIFRGTAIANDGDMVNWQSLALLIAAAVAVFALTRWLRGTATKEFAVEPVSEYWLAGRKRIHDDLCG